MTARELDVVIPAEYAIEGGGFGVYRPFPTRRLDHFDPFLLLDEKEPKTWGPGEAIGAPDHPHRGFETVSYVISGETEHRDSAGGHGIIRSGGIQWMTAGQGIVHSEMPSARIRAEGGFVHGFQIWVNLPRSHKMTPPRYQGLPAEELGVAEGEGWSAKIVAGEVCGVRGPATTHTPITYAHLVMQPGARVSIPVEPTHNVGLYVFAGEALVGMRAVGVAARALAVLEPGEGDLVVSTHPDAEGELHALVLTGEPIGEPVARHGPFVMNTREELIQAFEDYQAGRMGMIRPGGTA
jgi:redox-sensitive bicupin YhaK (pirin superfamily)